MGSNLAGDVAKKTSRHIPTLLTALSGVGLAATAVLFARAGIKAERRVQHEVRVNEEYEDRYPTYSETAFLVWPEYLIPTSVGVATLVCLISTNVLNVKNQATLMGMYALSERTWAKYRNKVAEMIGVENEQTVRTEVIKDVAAENKVGNDVQGEGDTIYMDVFSGQIFRSTEEKIDRGLEKAWQRAHEDGFVSLNYLYDQIGARTTEMGEYFGWDDGFGHGASLDITLTPVTFEDGTEGFGLDYKKTPVWGYHSG